MTKNIIKTTLAILSVIAVFAVSQANAGPQTTGTPPVIVAPTTQIVAPIEDSIDGY